MKKILLIIAAIAVTITIHAQVVALHTATGVQLFSGVNAFVNAYNTSISGDTIYLPGGGFTSPATIDKSLIIFGAGHYPEYSLDKTKTILNGDISLSDNADGFRLEGVELVGNLYTDVNEGVNNIVIRYCKITIDVSIRGDLGTVPTENLTLINCVINGNIWLNNAVNANVFNSIVGERILSSQGNTFKNNILLYNGGTGYYTIYHGDLNVCSNNIFLNASNRYFEGSSNQIFNNIFVIVPNFGTTPSQSGNYYPITHANIFVDQTGYTFDYSHDYHLQAPETYLGVNGTQVGIYGGDYPYKEGAVPSNPHFDSAVVNPTTTPDGKLHIEINSSAQ